MLRRRTSDRNRGGMVAFPSRGLASDPKPFKRGINSIQLMNDGSRWWIVSVFWLGEAPGHPIPAKHLPDGGQ